MYSLPSKAFQQAVLAWYDQYGRKTLPWQQQMTPYRVWVSEIMLQQTQVTTVVGYFERFMRAFPDIFALASASADQVMHAWTGLGYYSRARCLHKTAKIIVDTRQGIFPDNLADLSALPGIGRSTAAAILSIAFNQSATILDGNVKRVLSRFLGLTGHYSVKAVEKTLWDAAVYYTPLNRAADYTQVMMDLGATCCTRRQPQCVRCPLSATCVAHLSGQPENYPGKKPKKALPVKAGCMLILANAKGQLLVEKRPEKGIWGGLWCLPEYQGELSELFEWIQATYGVEAITASVRPAFRHTFTHFHYEITPVYLRLSPAVLKADLPVDLLWYDLHNPPRIGLAKPVVFLLAQLLEAQAEREIHT